MMLWQKVASFILNDHKSWTNLSVVEELCTAKYHPSKIKIAVFSKFPVMRYMYKATVYVHINFS